MGVSGHPRAWAMGRGMAITSGVSMNDLAPAGATALSPLLASCWFTTAPQELAAGDQMTGFGPSAASSVQPLTSAVAPAPEDLRCTRTTTQPPSRAPSLELKVAASSVSSSTFSGELATSTAAQPLGTSSVPDVLSPPPSSGGWHAASATTHASRATALFTGPT